MKRKNLKRIRKALQILSGVLLLANPASGIFAIYLCMYSYSTGTYWWLLDFVIPPLVVYMTMTFHSYTNRYENRLAEIKEFQWRREFSKTHTFISEGVDYGGVEYQVWQNNITKEYIEV